MSTVTLKWTVPTLYNDGSVLTAAMVDHADIFDSASATPLVPIGTVKGTINTFTTGVLTVGVHNFTVETTDTNGHESVPSNVFSANILPTGTGALPNPVTDLTGTINTGTATGPTVVSIGSSTGPVAGGTLVTIIGTGFQGATSVLFGANAATAVVVSPDGTIITATSPPGAAGVVDVTVITPNGQAVLPQSFTYA